MTARFTLLCLVIAALSAPSDIRADSDSAVPGLSGPLGKPVQLFNHKDLDGWVWVQRPPAPATNAADAAATPPPRPIADVWTVKDGILHTGGQPFGYIRTVEAYANYVLTVEQRHVNKGNGGILFAITGPDKVWPHCLECQGQVGEECDIRIDNRSVSRRHAVRKEDDFVGAWIVIDLVVVLFHGVTIPMPGHHFHGHQ